jgi:GTPase SAR1 family protein
MPQQHLSQLPRLGTLVSSLDGHQKVNLHCRIVVLGSAKVGKTAIVEQFLYEAFPVMHSATVEQLYRAEYEVRGTGM